MKIHNEDPDAIEPCKHMESMLNRTAEGTAPPLMRWYALAHAKDCKRCGTFLARITAMIHQLKGLKTPPQSSSEQLTDQDWEKIESRWQEVER